MNKKISKPGTNVHQRSPKGGIALARLLLRPAPASQLSLDLQMARAIEHDDLLDERRKLWNKSREGSCDEPKK